MEAGFLLPPPAAVVAALLALFVIPGITWGALLVGSSGNPLIVVGRTVGASRVVTTTTCTVLAVLGQLRPETVLGSLAALSALPLTVARTRRNLRRTTALSRRKRRVWVQSLGLAILVGASVLVPSHLRLGEGTIPASSTIWYYAHLADDTATAEGFPATIPEWGQLRPFQTDYAPFTAHTAAAFQLLPNDLLLRLETYRLAVMAAVILFASLLFRRFVSSWIAVLGAILLVTTVRLDFKLLAYKPEMFALALALFVAWVTDRAVTERSLRLTLVAAWGASLVFLAHAEVFLVMAPVLAGIAVARGLIRVGTGVVGLGRPDRRALLGAAIPLAVLLLGGVGGTLSNGAIAGEFRLVGYIADQGQTRRPVPQETPAVMPSDWRLTADPTWNFFVAAAAPGEEGRRPPERFTDRRLLPRAVVHVWRGLDGQNPEGLATLTLLVGAPFLAWPLLDVRRRRFLLIVAVFGVALLAGSFLLNEIAQTYVPRRAGGRRLVPYELLLPVAAAIVWLWATHRLSLPGWKALAPGRGGPILAACALLVLVVGAVGPGPDEGDPDESAGLSTTGLEAYRWMAQNLPPDARILANAYTDGSLTLLSERAGVLDGRAVYLEDPAFLIEATELVLGARRVFEAPAAPESAAFLEEVRVDYLLVAGPTGSGKDLGGYRPFPTDFLALETSEHLREVATFGDDRLRLLQVQRADAATPGVDPTGG